MEGELQFDVPPLALGLFRVLGKFVQFAVILWAMVYAYNIRLYAIRDFGPIIHEFDPWFNYRATEYLAQHGSEKFFKWFDHESWYPLGRPVGTTIYPGMQFTAVWIWEVLKFFPTREIAVPSLVSFLLPFLGGTFKMGAMSLNDVCCYIPCWFGAIATLVCALLTREVTGSWNAAAISAVVMAQIPAHLMRSIGGGYDNECVAMTCIVLTFWLWCRSLRSERSWPFAFLAGLAYFYMVATWGGYVFVVNLVGLHAAILVPFGLFDTKVWKAYSLFFVVGTALATTVPVVGWTPLKSLEQMGPLLVFLIYQVLEATAYYRRTRKPDMERFPFMVFRAKVFALCGAFMVALCFVLAPTGYFGPISSRIRGLFVKHTKTGNPLVDSVSEHQAASESAYHQYLHNAMFFLPYGLILLLINRSAEKRSKYFALVYSIVAYYFSLKMVRLIIICGPIASILVGAVLGAVLDFCRWQFWGFLSGKVSPSWFGDADVPMTKKSQGSPEDEGKKKKSNTDSKRRKRSKGSQFEDLKDQVQDLMMNPEFRMMRGVFAVVVVAVMMQQCVKPYADFNAHAERMAESMSQPQVVFKTRMGPNGKPMIIDDYLVAYQWVKENTPKDARVMAWWDYGYQISGIANRTTIADGNTWNHEHIATLARCLVSPEKRAHNVIRHMADYVLVWAGGGGDDLAKSIHMARIGNSVFPDICGERDPTCSQFGFHSGGVPTDMMRKSLIYKLHSHNLEKGVKVHPKLFKEVYTSQFGLVRVFKVMNVSQESKDWVANPENRVCDAPGSWYCNGQYPPAMQSLITKRHNFAQLEDFNVKGRKKSAYTRFVEENQGKGI